MEYIADERGVGKTKRLEYYVKWRGWPSADNTWEPQESLRAEHAGCAAPSWQRHRYSATAPASRVWCSWLRPAPCTRHGPCTAAVRPRGPPEVADSAGFHHGIPPRHSTTAFHHCRLGSCDKHLAVWARLSERGWGRGKNGAAAERRRLRGEIVREIETEEREQARSDTPRP